MNNNQKEGKQATPNDSLEEQIVSSTFPKNEREWWAHHEIDRLRVEYAALQESVTAKDLLIAALSDLPYEVPSFDERSSEADKEKS